jgi:hypothetical protein
LNAKWQLFTPDGAITPFATTAIRPNMIATHKMLGNPDWWAT